MSLINKEIGDFTVEAFQNGEFKTVTKADVLGKWALFFFYPADFTFVCPTELDELAENYDAFKAEGCEVYSVSCDTHFVHKAWHDESERISKVTYPMLADPAHVLAEDFEVLIPADGLAERGAFIVDPDGKIQVYEVTAGGFEVLIPADGLAERGAFIVDPDGKIQVYEVTAGGIGRNAKDLLRLVQAAMFVREHGDQVCPAKWQPGAETLKPSLDLVGQL